LKKDDGNITKDKKEMEDMSKDDGNITKDKRRWKI
jgi:hypothetical protein